VYGYRLMQMGILEEGLAVAREAVSVFRKYRPTNATSASYIDVEMYALDSMGRYEEGADRLAEAAALLAPVARTDPRWKDHARFEVERLISMGRGAEAADLASQASFRSTLKPGSLTRMDIREVLLVAECARLSGDAENAAAIARRIHEAIQAAAARRYFAVYEAKAALSEAKALVTLHRASEALPLAQAAVTQLSSLYDRGRSPELSDAQIVLANCYLMLHQADQARSLLASAEAIQATHRELGAQYTEPLRKLRAQFATGGR
jgi:tetratricopeptide (TPR) repeat protein